MRGSLYFITTLCLVLSVLVSARVDAAMVNGTTCDEGILDVMDQHAWLESKREMEVAQSIILKPDSVLAYSCFTQRANEVGADGDLVRDTANRYLSQNYGYNPAAGRYNHTGGACGLMAAVWEFSKCHNIDASLFSDLDDFVSTDPRSLPMACNEPNRSNKWQAALDAVDPVVNNLMEPMTAYLPAHLDLLDPVNCTNHRPVDTGIIIFESYETNVSGAGGGQVLGFDNFERPDRFCPAPGCYYQYDRLDLNGDGECLPDPGV